MISKYIRRCQECGHKQEARDPYTLKGEGWRELKCRRCKSAAMDFGSWQQFNEDGTEFAEPDEE